jgi:hypothetical protein
MTVGEYYFVINMQEFWSSQKAKSKKVGQGNVKRTSHAIQGLHRKLMIEKFQLKLKPVVNSRGTGMNNQK